jgi:hypothetical protein
MPRCHDHAKILGELEVFQQAKAVVGPVISGGGSGGRALPDPADGHLPVESGSHGPAL